jgi:hypothetical protein
MNNNNDNIISSTFAAITGSIIYISFADISKTLLIAFVSGFVGHLGTKAARYLIKFYNDKNFM